MGRGKAELEGCPRCIQILVLMFNLIFFIFGIAMLAYGIYVFVQIGDYVNISSVDYVTGSKLMIAVGVMITLISFLGCCGAWKLSKCMLICFFALLFIVFCCEIAAAVTGYMYRSKLQKSLINDMGNAYKQQYGESDKTAVTDTIDLLQEKEKCCGMNGSGDWKWTKWGSKHVNDVPESCCKDKTTGCGKIYTNGCYKTLVGLVEKYLLVIGGVGVGIVVIQLLGMIFAMVLICHIQKNGTYA